MTHHLCSVLVVIFLNVLLVFCLTVSLSALTPVIAVKLSRDIWLDTLGLSFLKSSILTGFDICLLMNALLLVYGFGLIKPKLSRIFCLEFLPLILDFFDTRRHLVGSFFKFLILRLSSTMTSDTFIRLTGAFLQNLLVVF